MATLTKLQTAAVRTGKLSSKVNFIRAVLNKDRETETDLTDDIIGQAIQKMPGNIGDDEYVADVVKTLTTVEKPSAQLRAAAGLTAQIDTTQQHELAVLCGAAWDAQMTRTMLADIEAGEQAKESPLHVLESLERLFGPNAPNDNLKNIILKWPAVDSEDTKDNPLVPRFEGDLPAKYRVKNRATGKMDDRDFYFIEFDASPIGTSINEEIAQLDMVINDKVGAKPRNEWPEVWGTATPDLKDRRTLLTSRKNNGRLQLKQAARVIQQLAAVNHIKTVVAKLLRDEKGNLRRPNPIYMYSTDPDNAEINQRCNIQQFLSYVPTKVKDDGGIKELLDTKPPKKGKGSRTPAAGTGKVTPDATMPANVHMLEQQWAMQAHWLDDKDNLTSVFKEGQTNKGLRMTLMSIVKALKPFEKKWDPEYQQFILEGGDIVDQGSKAEEGNGKKKVA
jgi:hypothetical protein